MHKIAERVLRKLGGARRVAEMLGTSPQAIYKWTYPREYGGTGGLIPHRRQLELMVTAKQRGIVLTADDFFPKVPHVKDQSSAESRQDV
jgi:hypothetical protein